MNNIDQIFSRIPPQKADVRLEQVDQYLWKRVDHLRMKNTRLLVFSGVVAMNFLIGIAIGHFVEKAETKSEPIVFLSNHV